MRIQNNITAMNTHRQYTINNDNVAKSAEKLSSGYRINRAGDDAAGLAISEKMRSQIRGLNMATKNSQDAISLVQTAEGALQETQNMLQRMNELAVQAATGTNETLDRSALAKEFEQLKREINDVAEQTTFNNMRILDGSMSYDGFKRSAQTSGITLTRPTVVGGTSSTPPSSDDEPTVLGSTITGMTLGSNDKTSTTIKQGEKLTLEAKYTDKDGNEQTVKFEAEAGTGGEKVSALIGKLKATGADANDWAVSVDQNGAVTVTALTDKNIDAEKPFSLELGTTDGDANLDTPKVEQATVTNVTSKPAEPASFTLKGVDGLKMATTAGNKYEDVVVNFSVSGTAYKATISSEAAQTTDDGTATVKTAADAKVKIEKADGTATDAFTGAIDKDGNLVITAKEGPEDESGILKATDISAIGLANTQQGAAPTVDTASFNGGAVAQGGDVSKAARADETESKEATKASMTMDLAGASVTSAAAGDKVELTLTIGGTDVKIESNALEAGKGTDADIAKAFDGKTVKIGDDDYTIKAEGTKLTITAPEAGATEIGGVTVKKFDMATGSAGTMGAQPTDKKVTVTEGTDAPEDDDDTDNDPTKPTSTGGTALGKYTMEFDVVKMRDGDTFDFDGTKVTYTKGTSAEDFAKKVAKDVYGDESLAKGNAIVSEDALTLPTFSEDDWGAHGLEHEPNAVMIQVGALENEQLAISIDSMNTAGLGLDSLDLYTQSTAGNAITAVRNAINRVSDQRATLGAMQNRLDHKIANLKVSSENLSAAESRIRDVDMAQEMTNFTKNNILSQAATAMLAQANALPQNVLSLLG